MNDIQRARDVLQKLGRADWEVSYDEDFDRWEVVEATSRTEHGFFHGRSIADFDREADAHRVASWAGNPDLLDAIDGLLAAAQVPPVPITVPVILLAQSIAAAILAADERMSA